jgi:hypothetical protein
MPSIGVPTDIQVKYLKCIMEPRYWEDASVNGIQEDDDSPTIPLRHGDKWIITIDLNEGKIIDWPNNTVAKVHYKICDAGEYILMDPEGREVKKLPFGSYVPGILAPNYDGYGDYVVLNIDSRGTIENFRLDLRAFTE